MSASAAAILADAVLVLHVCIAVFVVLGLVLVVVGNLAGWAWVNDLRFRLVHLVAIGAVVAEAWFGIACPLTLLEMALRERASGAAPYAGGFIEHWLGRLLYYHASAWVFVLTYTLFGLLVVACWWYFPPRRRGRRTDAVA